jgi:hypothetical protein
VAAIVAGCSDTFETPKPPWRERKKLYIEHLREVERDVLTVSLADKLDNARAILRDFRSHGPLLWDRFTASDPQDQLWYYRELAAVFAQRSDSPMAQELVRVVEELGRLVERASGTKAPS